MNDKLKNLIVRTLSGVVMLGVLLGCVLGSPWSFGALLLAVLVGGGLLSIYDMSKLEDPEIKVKQAMVVAVYPGASAHEVEMEVTDPLEKNIRTIGELSDVSSWSYNDLAILQVEMKTTVPDSEIEQCWDLLRRKVNDVQSQLPSGVSVSVRDDFGLVYGMLYALTGDGLTERQLQDYAELVKREIADLDGVARVEIYGQQPDCINISILPEKMATLGISPAEVLTTLNGQNDTYYAGYYDNGPDRIRVTVTDKFRTVEQIKGMVIQGHEDDQLRLGDIRHGRTRLCRTRAQRTALRRSLCVGHRHRRSIGQRHRESGCRSAAQTGRTEADPFSGGRRIPQNLLSAGACHRCVDDLFGQSARIGRYCRGNSHADDGLPQRIDYRFQLGHHRRRVVPCAGSHRRHDAARLAGCIHLGDGYAGRQRHRHRRRHLGRPPSGQTAQRSPDGHRSQTAMPLLGATLIAILAFFPVYLSPDTAGVYVRDLFIVLAVSLLLSWILALVHVPLMADHLLKGSRNAADGEKKRRSALWKSVLPVAARRTRIRSASSGKLSRGGHRIGRAECMGLQIHAPRILPRHGLRPTLHGV